MTLEIDLVRRTVAIERRLAEIEARERAASIVAIYTSSSGQSIPNNTFTIIDYSTREIDTHSAVTTGSSWKFTAPVSGYYHIDASIMFGGTTTWNDGEFGYLRIYLNGGASMIILDRKDNYGSASTVYMKLGGSTSMHLNAGDYIDIRSIQNSGSDLIIFPNSSYNRVAIARI
jgi:hypothetical protein